jgi:phage terminase large subunit-like protein
MPFELTPKQEEANRILGCGATHILLYGGSRSGKTFLWNRAIAMRALKAPGSRHAILRFRFNAVKAAIVHDTWPKMMSLCFPQVKWELNKSDWFAQLENGSQIWFGGLDDKERTEKILGQEYATIALNECSQIPWNSRNMAVTRLAQNVMQKIDGQPDRQLPLRMYYDENPPDKAHWSYRLFKEKRDPETKQPLPNPHDFACMQLNPGDNSQNLPAGYLESLQGLSARMQRRFLLGEFRDSAANALFPDEMLDKWRVIDGALPDMQRIVIAVDPSGSDDTDNAENDEIGICVAGLGTDGNGYLLEDLTLKAGPATWGKVATSAFDRHMADKIVAETNYGGAMVKHVIQTARPRTPFGILTASRGKVPRAEPISSLVETGKVRIVGYQHQLEDELAGFTTTGYVGDHSPNRADAFVWAFSELFPGIVRAEGRKTTLDLGDGPGSWMAA